MTPSYAAPRLIALAVGLAACGHSYKRSYPAPTVDEALARLGETSGKATSYSARSTMDYWIGKDRVKGTVLVMGELGAKLRFNALSPAGDAVIADMACDGTGFVYVDFQNNCVLTGPCDESSIAQFLRVRLAPDDFLHLAVGSTPVIPGATGTITWDAKHGHEVLDLKGTGGQTQRVVLEGKAGLWDVLSSEVKGADGKAAWTIENTDFSTVKDVAGVEHRVPGKTRFRSPAEEADLLVVWESRKLNVELDDPKFIVQPPAGLPACGRAK